MNNIANNKNKTYMYKSNKVTRFVILSVKVSLKLWALVYIFSLNKQLVVDASMQKAQFWHVLALCSIHTSGKAWLLNVIAIKKVTLLLQLALT